MVGWDKCEICAAPIQVRLNGTGSGLKRKRVCSGACRAKKSRLKTLPPEYGRCERCGAETTRSATTKRLKRYCNRKCQRQTTRTAEEQLDKDAQEGWAAAVGQFGYGVLSQIVYAAVMNIPVQDVLLRIEDEFPIRIDYAAHQTP